MTAIPKGASAVVVALVVAATATVRDARAENLQEAWAITLSVNQQLHAENLQTASAERSVAAARQERLPTVRSVNLNINLSTSPKSRLLTSVVGAGAGAGALANQAFPILGKNQSDLPISFTFASVPIYTGGRITNSIRAARSQQNAQQSEVCRTALDLKLAVAQAYVSVLRARRRLEVAESNVAQLQSFANDIQNRKKEGLATRNDELSAEVSLANARQGDLEARNALEIAWATYNRYLDRPPTATVSLDELSDPSDPLDLKQLTSSALRSRPELAGASEAEVTALTGLALQGRPELVGLTEQARSLGAQAESTRAGVRPQASFTGGFLYLGLNNFVPQGYGAAAFVLDWTMVDAPTRRKAESLKLQEESTLRRRADLAQDIMLQVRTRWFDLRTARQRISVARTAIAQAEENINVVLDRYRQQLSNNTDVLEAENRRIQSLNNYFNSVYDEALARFRLHRAVGDL
jgi:outer membrane protein TolC